MKTRSLFPGMTSDKARREVEMQMVRHIVIVAVLMVLLAPVAVEAQGRWQPGDTGSFRIFLGEFRPEGNSRYWDEKFEDWTGSVSDFNDFIFLGDYRMPMTRSSAALFGMSWYEGATTQSYRDWVDASGGEIYHRTTLRSYDFSAAWVFEVGGMRQQFTPYFGVGAGYVWWELVESGDFIDFTHPDLPVFTATYGSTASTWELFGIVGADIRLGHSFSLVVQGRWREASDELGGSMSGSGEIDLSGFDYELGFAFHF
jgi:hypothetical protein